MRGCVLAIGTRRDDHGPFGRDHPHQRMRGFVGRIGHLGRQRSARGQIRHQARKEPLVFRQELQRRIGEDEIGSLVRRPIRDVLLEELSLRRAHARMRKHGVGGVEADDACVRKATEKQFRAVAGTATQIIDETRRIEGNSEQADRARRASARSRTSNRGSGSSRSSAWVRPAPRNGAPHVAI